MQVLKKFMGKNSVLALGLLAVLVTGFINTPTASCSAFADGAVIFYEARHITVEDGVVHIQGYFKNYGNQGKVVNNMELTLQVYDVDYSVLWKDTGYFSNIGLYIGPEAEVTYNTSIRNDNCRALPGEHNCRIDCDIR